MTDKVTQLPGTQRIKQSSDLDVRSSIDIIEDALINEPDEIIILSINNGVLTSVSTNVCLAFANWYFDIAKSYVLDYAPVEERDPDESS